MFYNELNVPPPIHPTFKLSSQRLFTLAPNQPLISQGEVSHSIYWLERGLARAFFTAENGKAFTKEFFWEGDIIFQATSLLTGEPLSYSLVALETCHYKQLSIERYLHFVQSDPQWQQYHQRMLTLHLINKERKEEFLLLNSPEKRVTFFYAQFPWLVDRVSDYILASYLGVTPISFSRIRKRLGLF